MSVARQSRRHFWEVLLLCDGNGNPDLRADQRRERARHQPAIDLIDGAPPIVGWPARRRFYVLPADNGYSSEAFRQTRCERGTEPIIYTISTFAVRWECLQVMDRGRRG